MADHAHSENATGDRLDPAPGFSVPLEPEHDDLLDALVEEFTDRMHAGEDPNIESFVGRHPERAEQLKGLLTWAKAMAQVAGRSSSAEHSLDSIESSCPHAELGEFRLIREIGRGGMGVVYEAEQRSLGRKVALKVLPYAAMFDSRQLQRFKNEARAAATLDHPHIVSVYSVGFEQNVHFYAMQFVEGHSLAEVIARWRSSPHSEITSPRLDYHDRPGGDTTTAAGRPNWDEKPIIVTTSIPASRESIADAATDVSVLNSGSEPGLRPESGAEKVESGRTGKSINSQRANDTPILNPSRDAREPAVPVGWVIGAALALEHAHRMGIVHRDVKPSNLLVNDRGHLWVADFGLAMTDGDSGLTRTGDVPGTLRYMSPEQLRGDRAQLDHRTDIYSLGLTLFELLTLEPAFPESNRVELTKRIVETGIRSPRSLNRSIPRELELIIFKAADRDPANRYQTAGEFGEDLRRFLNAEPIRARSSHSFLAALRWIVRRPTRVAVLAGSLIALAAGVTQSGLWPQRESLPGTGALPALAVNAIETVPPVAADVDMPEHGNANDMSAKIREGWRSGSNSFEAGYVDAAINSLTRAVDSYLELVAERPVSASEKLYGILAEASLGRVLWKTGRLEQSVPHLNEGLTEISQLSEQRQLDDRDRTNAASVCFQIADLWLDLLLWEEAAEHYRKGLAIAPDSMPVHRQWMYLAYMTAASGDDEAYHALTRKAYERYHDDNDADVRCFLTQALCIGSNAGVDRDLTVQMADKPWLAPQAIDPTNRLLWVTHAVQAHLDAGHLERADELAPQMTGLTLIYAIYATIEAHRGRENLANYWLEHLESARREDARVILLSRPNETSMNDWPGLVNSQTCSVRAQHALHRERVLANPWILLIQGRNRGLLRNYNRAQKDFHDAVESLPDDSDLLNARGRIFLELGWDDRAAEDFDRARQTQASASSPQRASDHAVVSQLSASHEAGIPDQERPSINPTLKPAFPANEPTTTARSLIAQAHTWLERGDTQAAESWFSQTLSLPDNELDLFLQTDGWWLAGPCPSDLETACSPEASQVLGRPIDEPGAIDAAATTKLDWRRMPSVGYGTVELWRKLPQDSGCSAYLLTYVYSPVARSINLHVGSDGPRRVWLNGRLLHTSRDVRNWDFDTDQISLELQEGRNALLVKLSGASTEKAPQHLFARLDDSPIDRARALADAYLFPEASDMFEVAARRGGVIDISTAQSAAYAAAAAGKDQRFRQIREGIWEHDRHAPHDPYWTARVWSLRPGVPDQHDRWLSVLQQGFQPPIDEGRNVRIHAALAQFRLGRHAEALNEIEKVASNKYPHSWPIMAMIQHGLGLSDQAAESMQRAVAWRQNFLSNFPDTPASEKPPWWGSVAEFETLYREACSQIGERNPMDDGWWQLAIARGHHRLGQHEAAQSALQATDEYTRIDLNLLAARGAVYAEIGQFDRAAEDFESARKSITSGPQWHALSRHLTGAAKAAELAERPTDRDRFQQQAVEAKRAATAAGVTIHEYR